MPTKKQAIIVFVASTLLTMVFEYLRVFELQVAFKPLIVLSILYLYSITYHQRSYIYEIGLVLSLSSNIFLLARENLLLLTLGILVTILYLILYIIIILKNTRSKNFFAVLLCSLPLLMIAGYDISLFSDNLNSNFWSVIAAASLICLFCGLAFYTYFLQKSRKNLYLLVSGICLFFMSILFSLETFYINIEALRAATVGTFAIFQYSFYLYVMEYGDEGEQLIDESIL